jgi:phosphoglycolate phosphatase-like HAD superfamily hydrolase
MLEIVVPGANASAARVVLFDFDGTLSLIRSGWMDVMVPMMVEILADLRSGESAEDLRRIVEDFVWRLTGQETVYQMIELARQVELRGGRPFAPLIYKRMYLDRLWERIRSRVRCLERGEVEPDEYLVPGSRALLEELRRRGMRLYLASGTDEEYMKREAELLDLTRYFDGGVFGAIDDYRRFSKGILIRRIIGEMEFTGAQFLGFGDGYVEIEEVKNVGGTAVGLATAEPECRAVDEWKRQRLIGVGADFIAPNYLELDEMLGALFPS